MGLGEEEETLHLMEPRKNVFVPDIFISQSSSGSREAQDDLSTVPGLQSSSSSSFLLFVPQCVSIFRQWESVSEMIESHLFDSVVLSVDSQPTNQPRAQVQIDCWMDGGPVGLTIGSRLSLS